MDSILEVLPDDLLLLILNHVSSQDVKSLVLCSAVSRRLCLLVPLVRSVIIHVHCYFFYEDHALLPPSSAFSRFKPRPLIFSRLHYHSSVVRNLVSDLLHPYHLGYFNAVSAVTPLSSIPVVHRIPQHVIKNFPCLRALHVVLPVGELCLGDDSSSSSSSILFCWRAHFGSSFKRCLILAAASVTSSSPRTTGTASAVALDKDAICNSLRGRLCSTYTESSVLAASERLGSLWHLIAAHRTLESLVISDADGQGVLFMDRDQLVELRKDSITQIRRAKVRTWEWFAPVVELSSGVVLKEVMVVAVLPTPTTSNGKEEEMGLGWVEEGFGGGMQAEVVRMLVKGRKHSYKEMNCLSLN